MASRPRTKKPTNGTNGTNGASDHLESDDRRPYEITYEQGKEILDEYTRRRLDMTADEFLRAWDAGEFPDDLDAVPGLVGAYIMIPLARPVYLDE